MEKTDDYILIGQYFTYEEAESIKERFTTAGIEFLINTHGPNFELDAKYYQIKVKSDDAPKAEEIVKKEKEAFREIKTKCPACGQSAYEKVKQKNLFEKIMYVGTELVKCRNCGTKYGI
jgi:uncharacterized protein with PIN domain